VQSVAQASFDAWTRSYRADENTPNVTVSYYTKGALLALCCDLRLRERGQGRSLDDVMRRLWRRHRDGGVAEADILAAISQVAGIPMRDELIAWVHGTVELPLQALLERAGVRWSEEPLPLAGRLGLRLSESAFTGVQVRQVLRGSAAERAGIATGDELLALDGWRLRRLEDARGWWAGAGAGPGTQPGELLLSRDGRICRVLLEAAPPEPASTVTLTLAATPSAEAAAIRRSWLGA
jgi:predicted metalloprotease with PDZ domain